MAIACHKCGVETEIPEAFFRRHKSFRLGLRTECPQCYAESELATLRRQIWWSVVAGLVGLAVALIWPDRKGGWLLLNVFIFELFLIGTILPHEWGHAFVARWLGWKVFKVYVGYGRTVFRKNLFGFPTEFKAVPFGGLTIAAPLDSNWFRLKQLAFTFAGSLASIMLCGLALLFVSPAEIWDFASVTQKLVPGRVFFYANVFVLVQNLWPYSFDSPIGRLSNDGKLLWKALFLKSETIDDCLEARFVLEAMRHYETQEYDEALNWIEQGLTHYPEKVLLLNWKGILLIESREYEMARDCFKKILVRPDNTPTARALMLNNVAYADALLGGAECLAEADRYSEEAISLLGWIPAVKGTRGSTLLEMGRIDEALPLLRESMEHADQASGKAQNACFIAIGEARRGNLTESRKYLVEARRLAPNCFLLERAEAAQGALSTRDEAGR